jgi:hypothetical protein
MEPVGYIKLFRSIESSEDFAGLRADQAWVAVRILQLANFKPAFHSFRGQPIRVGRGELAHTLDTIAKRAHTTIKVVRTTIARLQRTGFLGTRTGTVAGTPYRILIVKNYERFQGEDSDTGTAPGTAAGSDRARTGHESGTDRALREEGEEGKKSLSLDRPGYYGLAEQREAWGQRHPLAARLLVALNAAGVVLNHPVRREVTDGIERSLSKLTTDAAAAAVVAAHADDPNDSLGWYAKALARAAGGVTGTKPRNPLAAVPAAKDFSGGF